MTHQELCARALRWLSGSQRCEPVFCSVASCSEIPDAIGWSSRYRSRGSIIVECKASRSDFYADQKKGRVWKHPEHGWYLGTRISQKEAKAGGYVAEELSRMGDFRFYLCLPDVITAEMVEANAPDHGLLHVTGKRIKVVREAPQRTNVNYPAEIRYLRFAIINNKESFVAGEAAPPKENTP